MPATLEALVTVRSQLVEEVLSYLDDLAKRMAELPSYYPAHLRTIDGDGKTRFDEIRQMVQVVEDHSAFEQWLAQERERVRAAGQDFDRLAYAPSRARPEMGEEDDRHRDRPAPPPPIVWDEHAGNRGTGQCRRDSRDPEYSPAAADGYERGGAQGGCAGDREANGTEGANLSGVETEMGRTKCGAVGRRVGKTRRSGERGKQASLSTESGSRSVK